MERLRRRRFPSTRSCAPTPTRRRSSAIRDADVAFSSRITPGAPRRRAAAALDPQPGGRRRRHAVSRDGRDPQVVMTNSRGNSSVDDRRARHRRDAGAAARACRWPGAGRPSGSGRRTSSTPAASIRTLRGARVLDRRAGIDRRRDGAPGSRAFGAHVVGIRRTRRRPAAGRRRRQSCAPIALLDELPARRRRRAWPRRRRPKRGT